MKKANAMFMSVLAALVLAAAIGPASAAGNEVAYNQVGVRFFDRQKVLAGEMYAAPNGQQVPSSITYTDAAGGKPTISLSGRSRKYWTPTSVGTARPELSKLRAVPKPTCRTSRLPLRRTGQKMTPRRSGNSGRLPDLLRKSTRRPSRR